LIGYAPMALVLGHEINRVLFDAEAAFALCHA